MAPPTETDRLQQHGPPAAEADDVRLFTPATIEGSTDISAHAADVPDGPLGQLQSFLYLLPPRKKKRLLWATAR